MVAAEGPESLIGEELSEVAFVRDYVEFHFDGPVLRALSDPLVRTQGRQYAFPDPGSRDALCSLISQVVESVQVVWDEHRPDDQERIEITMTTGSTVIVPLYSEDRDGPEFAHFLPCNPDGSLRVVDMRIW